MSPTLSRRIEILYAVFNEFAQDGNVSFQMDTDRGGPLIQLSNREWPDGIIERVTRAGQLKLVDILPNRYSTVIRCKGDLVS